MPKLTHENDGLVFNPLEDVGSAMCNCVCSCQLPQMQSYTAGQSPFVLKWKPPSLNTVDFKLAIVETDRPG